MSVCMGGTDPYNCPVNPCAGCKQIVIHSKGKAQLCPVCQGAGGRYDYSANSTSVYGGWKTCHGCGGKGWVTV
jgi:hypothetical protein